MRYRLLSMLCAAWVCVVCPAATNSLPLADRLPAETLLYVGWAGRSLPFDGSMFGQLVNDPAVGSTLQAVRSGLERSAPAEDDRQAVAHFWEMARIAWQHPIAVALIDLKKTEAGPLPMMAAVVDLGKDREAFAGHMEAQLTLARKEVTFTRVPVGGVDFHVSKPRGEPQIAYAYLGNLLVFTLGEGTPELLVQLPASKALAARAEFSSRMKQVGGEDVQLAYYVDIAGLVKRAEQLLPPPAPPGPDGKATSPAEKAHTLLAAMGLDRASALAGTVRIVERGMYGRAKLFAPRPHGGLLMPLAGAPVSDADVAHVPADTDILAIVKLSAKAGYEELRSAVRKVDPRAEQEMLRGIGELEEELGISLSRDLFPSLGDTWTLASAPSLGGFLTGTLLTVSVTDAARLDAALRKIEAKAAQDAPKGLLQSLKVGRAEIRYLAFGAAGDSIPVAPAWAVHNNRFYLAAYPQVIQTALAAGKGTKSILQAPEFRAARARLAGKPSILLYCNTPRIIERVYHWALVGWTFLANQAHRELARETGISPTPAWLPPVSSIRKYLLPSISAISSDEEGILFEEYGSLPSTGLAQTLALNPVVLAFAVPTFQSANQRAQTTVEISELHQLTIALILYQTEHRSLPPSLNDPNYLKNIRDADLKRQIAAGAFVYLPPRGKPAPPGGANRILIYRPAGPGRPWAIAGFADGHIERIPAARFEAILRAQRAREAARQAAPGGSR